MKDWLIKNKKFIVLSIFFLTTGFLFGRTLKKEKLIVPKVLREDGYKLIKPILLCNTDNQQAVNEDLSLSKKINEYLQSNSKNNNISVYYLSLLTGKWSSINENEVFSPASMLKVSTVIDILKYNESHPGSIIKNLYFDGSFDKNKAEYFKPQKSILPGKYYSVDDLIKYTISFSDNNAVQLLHNEFGQRPLEELYADLRINIPKNQIDFMSAKTFSLILRVLYNSTYLSREMSEKVLDLMVNTDFPIGLKAGVPKEVDVAQKFGERQVFTPMGEIIKRELHDCGIIYHNDSPYILCVMTSGNDFNKLAANISDISKIVYNHINQ